MCKYMFAIRHPAAHLQSRLSPSTTCTMRIELKSAAASRRICYDWRQWKCCQLDRFRGGGRWHFAVPRLNPGLDPRIG
jgi:hypothetical protein